MLKSKSEKLITAGEFAKLAESTKRTIHWYTQQGLLKPKIVNTEGYRFYSTDQITDLQVIMLLRRLNFSLPEVKKFLEKNTSTKDLFLSKKKVLLHEVKELQRKIEDISKFYENLEAEGVLIKPTIKTIPSFEAYYLEKIGPYAKILDYCFELKSYFFALPKNTIYFVLFPEREYAPKKDKLKIGIVAKSGMKIKKEAEEIVKREIIPAYKAATYTHKGSPALISFLIMQVHAYMDKNHIQQNLTVPINELEFYRESSLNKDMSMDEWVSEITIPII